MKSFLYRLFHKPSFVHRYSSITMYFCLNVVKPRVIGHDVYFPVPWFKADISDILKSPQALPEIRKALSYRYRK